MLKLYNTLTRKKEIFKPINPPQVGIYVCGPTIYGPSHLGHARTYLAFDVIRRYLEYRGYQVKYVMNITDIHDDMIKTAHQQGISIEQLTEKYLPLFHQDMEKLGVKKADFYPRVSQHIPEIITMIQKLIDKGYAYVKNGSVYYDVSKFKNYGQLSGVKLAQAKTGTRIATDKYIKKQAVDFALWKAVQGSVQGLSLEVPPRTVLEPSEPSWQSPWGQGRPGWHIECSVMSQKYLGERLDIHGGARDLIFPHHENEIAQSEAVSGQKPFVQYWLHAGLLKVRGQKMSKSLGNYIELPDILAKYDPLVIRYFLIKQHYRSVLDYTEEGVREAKNSLERIWEFVDKLNRLQGQSPLVRPSKKDALKGTVLEFKKHMDDDFNTPRALGVVFDLVKQGNKLIEQNKLSASAGQAIYKLLAEFDQVLGVLIKKTVPKKLSPEIKKLVEEREQARGQQDWAKADQIRREIGKRGYQIEDTAEGPQIKRL